MFYSLIGYHKIPIISPGILFVQKVLVVGLFFGELIFGGLYYQKALLSEGILRFKMGWA